MIRKYIPIPIYERDKFNEENYLDKYIRINFCNYIFKRGIYEGKLCNISCYNENTYCKKHFKLLQKKIDSENKRMKIQRCNKCNRRCIENESYCRNHKSLCKNKNNNFNTNNLQIIKYVPNTFSNIINIHFAEKKKQKNKRKKLRYKNNKKLKKLENDKIVFNYNEILKYKKGILFKENNIWYTYNLYEEKKIADCVDGNKCNYCGYIRYINSGPCIYADCINRSFNDNVFQTYYKINNKELVSIYNKRINFQIC
jgi:hypothetical protein